MMLWFGRNQRIFNNIVRHTEPGDRVLVIYGAGHGNLLQHFASGSGFYRVHDATTCLDGKSTPEAVIPYLVSPESRRARAPPDPATFAVPPLPGPCPQAPLRTPAALPRQTAWRTDRNA